MKTGLVWFKNDLRLHDNEALTKAIQKCDELIFCYAIENSHRRTDMAKFECTNLANNTNYTLYVRTVGTSCEASILLVSNIISEYRLSSEKTWNL